jgi:hypothetical protein
LRGDEDNYYEPNIIGVFTEVPKEFLQLLAGAKTEHGVEAGSFTIYIRTYKIDHYSFTDGKFENDALISETKVTAGSLGLFLEE